MNLVAISATDYLNVKGGNIERALEFYDPEANKIAGRAIFPDDRITLSYRGKLYDWYGREVALNGNIDQVVAYFGGSYCDDKVNLASERFVVKTTDHKFTIANLDFIEPNSRDVDAIPPYKRIRTGNILGLVPILRPDITIEKFDRVDAGTARGMRAAIFSALLERPMFLDRSEKDIITFYRGDIAFIGCLGTWFKNYVFKSRTEALATVHPDGAITNARPCGYLVGNVYVSSNSLRLIAHAHWKPDGSPTDVPREAVRIATDAEVIRLRKDACICWYYDE